LPFVKGNHEIQELLEDLTSITYMCEVVTAKLMQLCFSDITNYDINQPVSQITGNHTCCKY